MIINAKNVLFLPQIVSNVQGPKEEIISLPVVVEVPFMMMVQAQIANPVELHVKIVNILPPLAHVNI